ncbi:hypothetical protein JW998_04515 [candidate division KSB1 bacterium]|nr:hypothetical protein [candidate division KSB1 bacterium]
MKLSAPKSVTFIIALVLAVLGILASQGIIIARSGWAVGLLVAGFVVLAIGNMVKGL